MLHTLFDTTNDPLLTVLRLILGAVFFVHGAQQMLGWYGGSGFKATMQVFTNLYVLKGGKMIDSSCDGGRPDGRVHLGRLLSSVRSDSARGQIRYGLRADQARLRSRTNGCRLALRELGFALPWLAPGRDSAAIR